MRLTSILLFGKRPHGFKYRGKNRCVKEIKPKELQALKVDYERTEQNMLILRHPYLTVEQSFGHMSHVDKYPMLIERWNKTRNEKFANHTTLADRLSHLKVTEAWD